MPNVWISTPFTFLGQWLTLQLLVDVRGVYGCIILFPGIVAEGGASASFANRSESTWQWQLSFSPDKCPVGIAKANEMLIWGKKKEAQELLDCGFLKFAFFKSVVPCLTEHDLVVKSSRNSRWKNSTRKFGIF